MAAETHPRRLLVIGAVAIYVVLIVGGALLYGVPRSPWAIGVLAGLLARVVLIPTIVLVLILTFWKRPFSRVHIIAVQIGLVVLSLAGHGAEFGRLRAEAALEAAAPPPAE